QDRKSITGKWTNTPKEQNEELVQIAGTELRIRMEQPHNRALTRQSACPATLLKLIVVPIDSTWMRHSLTTGSRARPCHASRARAGRSRQRQSKWADSTRRCTRTALVTPPFSVWHDPGSSAFSARPCVNYITKLTRTEIEAAEWQAAMKALILVGTLGGLLTF